MSIFYDKIKNNVDKQCLFFNKELPGWNIKNNFLLTTENFNINCDLRLTKKNYFSNLEFLQITNKMQVKHILIKEGGKLIFKKNIILPLQVNKVKIYNSFLGYDKTTKKCQIKIKDNEPYYMNKVSTPEIQFIGIEDNAEGTIMKTGITDGDGHDLFDLTFHHNEYYNLAWIKKFGLVSLPENFKYRTVANNFITWEKRFYSPTPDKYFVSIPLDKKQRQFYEIEPTNKEGRPFSLLDKNLCFLKRTSFPGGKIDYWKEQPSTYILDKTVTKLSIQGEWTNLSSNTILLSKYTYFYNNKEKSALGDLLMQNEWIYIGLQAQGGNSKGQEQGGGGGAYALFCLHCPYTGKVYKQKHIDFIKESDGSWTVGNFIIEKGSSNGAGGKIKYKNQNGEITDISNQSLIQEGNVVYIYGCAGTSGNISTGTPISLKYDSRPIGQTLKFLDENNNFFAGENIAEKYWFWQNYIYEKKGDKDYKHGGLGYLTGMVGHGEGQTVNIDSPGFVNPPSEACFIYGF